MVSNVISIIKNFFFFFFFVCILFECDEINYKVFEKKYFLLSVKYTILTKLPSHISTRMSTYTHSRQLRATISAFYKDSIYFT